MVKVSISLPNNAHITLESEESELLREIVALVLRDLPRDLMRLNISSEDNVLSEKGKDDAHYTISTDSLDEPSTYRTVENTKPPSEPLSPITSPDSVNNQSTDRSHIPPEFHSTSGRTAFEAFCQKANPLGDMRRVVVAAEGATRHFGVDGVNSADLGWLFDAAGWRKPGDFTQTLRNAARSKFGWLERIPGRSGRYAATPLGISKTISVT